MTACSSLQEKQEFDDSAPWNFSWIVPGDLAATACPESVENLNFLIKQGITHLVTLSPDHIPPIDKIHVNIEWNYIPINEFEAPTLDDINTFIKIAEKAKNNKQAVAVHCRAGRGRTGVMIACYFVYFLEMSPDMAINKIRLMRPGSIETYVQVQSVRLYHDYLRKK